MQPALLLCNACAKCNTSALPWGSICLGHPHLRAADLCSGAFQNSLEESLLKLIGELLLLLLLELLLLFSEFE